MIKYDIPQDELANVWDVAVRMVAAKTVGSCKVTQDHGEVETLFIGKCAEWAHHQLFGTEFDDRILTGGDKHAPDTYYKNGEGVEIKLRLIYKSALYCDLCLSPKEIELKADWAVLALVRANPVDSYKMGGVVTIEFVGRISKANFDTKKISIRFNQHISRIGVKMKDLELFEEEPYFSFS